MIIGIDLGTTNSLVGVYRDGKVQLIPNEYGEYLTPSVVYVKNNECIVGKAAREKYITEPQNTAREFKRLMGSNETVTLGGRDYYAKELSAIVLKKLKEDAEKYLGEEVTEAVISVPAYFDDKQRWATKNAGIMAGLNVERLINEPSAAALACKLDNTSSENIMVFDFGGGTLDVSIVECFGDVLNVLAICGDNKLGGADFDLAISEYFCQNNGIERKKLKKTEQNSLLLQCENVKCELSEKEEVTTKIYLKEKEYDFSLSRKQLTRISSEIFMKIERIVASALMSADLDISEIDQLALVGGSSKMPVVRQFIEYLFNDIQVVMHDPDEIVARGVVSYAGIKNREAGIGQYVVADICPFSLGTSMLIDVNGIKKVVYDPIIPKNSQLPISKENNYITSRNGQRELIIEAFQGDSFQLEKNKFLDKIKISIRPMDQGDQKIKVRFTYDINGLLLVNVRILSEDGVDEYEKVLYANEDYLQNNKEEKVNEIKNLTFSKKSEEEQLLISAFDLFEKCTERNKAVLGALIEKYEIACEQNRRKYKEIAKRDLLHFIMTYAMVEKNLFSEVYQNDWYQTEEE